MGTQTERVPMYKDRMVVVVVVSAEITADGAVSLKELGRFAAEYPQEQWRPWCEERSGADSSEPGRSDQKRMLQMRQDGAHRKEMQIARYVRSLRKIVYRSSVVNLEIIQRALVSYTVNVNPVKGFPYPLLRTILTW